MISSDEALNYNDLTERTNNLINYIIEPSIKKSAIRDNRYVKILMFDDFTNLTLYEKLFCVDKSLSVKYFSEYDSCYRHNIMFLCNNKSIIKTRLNYEISTLGYNVVFQDIKHDKITDGFSIVITW